MSMTSFLLCSLRDRMNLMFTETMQLCTRHKELEKEISDEKMKDKFLIMILHEIKDGDIKSSHFTPKEAERAIEIYEYIHNASINKVSDKKFVNETNNDCFEWYVDLFMETREEENGD